MFFYPSFRLVKIKVLFLCVYVFMFFFFFFWQECGEIETLNLLDMNRKILIPLEVNLAVLPLGLT